VRAATDRWLALEYLVVMVVGEDVVAPTGWLKILALSRTTSRPTRRGTTIAKFVNTTHETFDRPVSGETDGFVGFVPFGDDDERALAYAPSYTDASYPEILTTRDLSKEER